jgi:hypothetical protein
MLNRELVAKAETIDPVRRVVLDMDSTVLDMDSTEIEFMGHKSTAPTMATSSRPAITRFIARPCRRLL